MKLNRWLTLAGIAAAMCLGTTQGLAQQNNQPGGRPRRGNFDPAQFRERIMERMKEALEITDDSEWKAIQPLVQKVMDLRMASRMDAGRMMFMRSRRDDNGGQSRRPQFGPPPSPEAQALQRAIEGKASNSQLKAAIAKYDEARKAKEAQLVKAQDELRKVLTVRQEAILTAYGLL